MSTEETQATTASAPSSEFGCGLGCGLTVVGAVAGFFVERAVTGVLVRSWSTCIGFSQTLTVEGLPDWSRISLIGSGGLYLLAYSACLPLGAWVAHRLPYPRARWSRAATGLLLALALLAAVACVDLTWNAAAKYGFYRTDLCPTGRPPWWPGWWPLHSDGFRVSPG